MALRIAHDLLTDRLTLGAWNESDTSWHADLVAERTGEPADRPADAELIRGVVHAQEEHGVVPSVVRVQGSGDAIGYCGLVVGRSTLDEPELAYELFRRSHGRGYATEAAHAVIAAAREAGYERLWSTTREGNAPSRRVLDKLGFALDRTEQDDRGPVLWHVLAL